MIGSVEPISTIPPVPNEQLVTTHASLQSSTDQNTFSATPYSYNNLLTYDYDLTRYSDSAGKNGLTLGLDNTTVTSIFKGLLNSEDDLTTSGSGQIDPELLQKLVNRALEESGLADITDAASKEMLREQVQHALAALSERERQVLELRFGLVDGKDHTLEEVSRYFKVTRERIRQIEAKALRKLRHPTRVRHLQGFLEAEEEAAA